jgi:hypothetical protein
LPKIDANDGSGFGFDIVIGNEPEIGVRLALDGLVLNVRLTARDRMEAREESKIDAIEGVC